MILAFHGIKRPEAEIRRLIRTKSSGTHPVNLLHLQEWCVDVSLDEGSVSDLQALLNDGIPPLVFVGTEYLGYWSEEAYSYMHTLVIVGLETRRSVLVNDSSFDEHPLKIPLDEFERAWRFSGCLMAVICPSNDSPALSPM
jgi:ABC-type bacteriocin/lantibiotic exporter with double-glycine peptidase domain